MIFPTYMSPSTWDAVLFPQAMSSEPPSDKLLRAMAMQEAAQPKKRRLRKSACFPAKSTGLLLALTRAVGLGWPR